MGIRGDFTEDVMFEECLKGRIEIHKTDKRMGRGCQQRNHWGKKNQNPSQRKHSARYRRQKGGKKRKQKSHPSKPLSHPPSSIEFRNSQNLVVRGSSLKSRCIFSMLNSRQESQDARAGQLTCLQGEKMPERFLSVASFPSSCPSASPHLCAGHSV